MRILLFDIDGTLIHSGGAGGKALRSAFCDLFDITAPRDVAFSGRTDRAIGDDFFALHAVENSPGNWQRLQQEYLARLVHWLPRCPGCVLPGIAHLLQHLSHQDQIALGLLTGNLRQGAQLKLEHYRLAHFFSFGGYGDDHLDRNHVAEVAVSAARDHLCEKGGDGDVWVIGDTPLDIRCARWIKARVLAVATGVHSRDELATHDPDVLLDDLSDVDHVLSLVLE